MKSTSARFPPIAARASRREPSGRAVALRQTVGLGSRQPWCETDIGSQLPSRPQTPAHRSVAAGRLSNSTAVSHRRAAACAETTNVRSASVKLSKIVLRPIGIATGRSHFDPKSPSFRGVLISSALVIKFR